MVEYCSISINWAENKECLQIIIMGKGCQDDISNGKKKVSLNQLSKSWV
jgi:hypothetical protein